MIAIYINIIFFSQREALKVHGGATKTKSVRNIVRYMFSIEVLQQYTWSRGAVQFKQLNNINHLIITSVKHMTNDKYKNIVIKTLKYAKAKKSAAAAHSELL
jgi:hypothetical protein